MATSAALQAICLRLSQIDNYIVTLVGVNGGNYWPTTGTRDPSKSLIDDSLIALYGFLGAPAGTYPGAVLPYYVGLTGTVSTGGTLSGGPQLIYGTTPGLVTTATAMFNGGGGDDWIVGSKINQSLYGNGGNDVVNGAGGSDTLNGGTNRRNEGSSVSGSSRGDTVSFQASGNGVKRWSNPFGLNYDTGTTNFTNPYNTGVVVNLVLKRYSYKGGSGSVVDFESVWGSDGNDTIIGDALGDHLYGGAGNDVITAGAGHDWVQGGSGNNTLDGGAGNNWLDYAYLLGGPQYLNATPISPYFIGGPLLGADQFRTTLKPYTFQTPLSSQFFTVGPRQSLIVDLSVVNASGQTTATVSATQGAGTLYYQTDLVKNFQAVYGGAGNDIIVGNTSTTNIVGNGGDNILYGAGSSASAPAGSLFAPAAVAPMTILAGTGGDLARGPSGNNLVLMAAGGNQVISGYGDGPTPGRKTTISFQTVTPSAPSSRVVVPAVGSLTTLTPYAGVTGLSGTYAGTDANGSTRGVTIVLGETGSPGSYDIFNISGVNHNRSPIRIGNTGSIYHSGVIYGVDNAVGSDGNDIITGNSNNDVLSGGLGNDTLIGGIGDDTLYGGAGTDVLIGGAISTITGDAGVNRFYVGYDYVPGLILGPTDSWINHSTFNAVVATDYITDWYNRHDYLQVSLGSQATITGLFVPGTGTISATTNTWSSIISKGTVSRPSLASLSTWTAANWNGDDVIDQGTGILNHGTITIDAGEGNNTINLKGGVTNGDTLTTNSITTYGTASLLNIRAGSGNDTIILGDANVLSDPTAGVNNAVVTNRGRIVVSAGDGDNLVNAGGVSTNTATTAYSFANTGSIDIRSGSGNDNITAGDGINLIHAGSGFNVINLGTTYLHSDKVYISEFGTRNIVNGFGANDKIYISDKLVDTLGGAIMGNASVVTNGTLDTALVATGLHDQQSPSLSGPQSDLAKPIYDPLFWSNLGRLSYSYTGVPNPTSYSIPGFNSEPGMYTSNGGYTNQVMAASSAQASTQVIAGGAAMIASGYILVATIILAPAGIALQVTGGLILAGGIIYRDNPPRNGTLDSGLTGYANTLEGTANVTFSPVSWTARDFNSLIQSANSDGLTPTLEVMGQPRYLNNPSNDRTGINTIVAITNAANTVSGYSTMIYLVHSRDNMIQNNEATLLAQVDNKVSAGQLVTYSGDALAVHMAPPVTGISVLGANTSGNVPYVLDVNTPTPVLDITVDESGLASGLGYTLYIYDGNTQLAALSATSTNSALRTFSFTDNGDSSQNGGITYSAFRTRLGVAGATTLPPNPQANYRVSTVSDQGIGSAAKSYTLIDKTTVIKSIDFTGSGVTVHATTAGTISLTSITGSPTASVAGAPDAASGTLTLSSIVAGLTAKTYESPIASSLQMVVGGKTSTSTQMFQLATKNSATLNAVAGVDNGLYALGDFAVINGSATMTFVTAAGALPGTSVVVPASTTVLTAGSDVIVAPGSDTTINLSAGTRGDAKIIIAPGDSPLIVAGGHASGYDTVTNFRLGDGSAHDILQLDNDGAHGPVLATGLAATSGTGITNGRLISDGIFTFDELAGLNLDTTTTLARDLTNIQGYLDAVLGVRDVVAFQGGSDTWVFEKGANPAQDTLVKLVGVQVQHLALSNGNSVWGTGLGDLRLA